MFCGRSPVSALGKFSVPGCQWRGFVSDAASPHYGIQTLLYIFGRFTVGGGFLSEEVSLVVRDLL